jgi:hypothetical protein
MDKRYQVFLSSTFRDLRDERQAVLLAIQKLNHIPTGMELFPSANVAPWDLIARIIANSDYYVLIVGGRYGSTDENGISFTEREHALALELKIPVLAFLHHDPGQLTFEHSEANPVVRQHLESFRQKVESLHHRVYWRNADDLATAVVVGLVNEIVTNPRVGWVRADFADDRQKLLSTVEMVRQENDSLRLKNEQLSATIADAEDNEFICQGTDKIVLKLRRRVDIENSTKVEIDDVETTWHELFMALAWDATSGATDDTLMRTVARKYGDRYFMDDDTWRQIATQFLALDLLSVRQEMRPSQSGFMAGFAPHREQSPRDVPTDVWHLTDKGRHLFAKSSAIKRD